MIEKRHLKLNSYSVVIFSLLSVAVFILCFLFPVTGDDWEWKAFSPSSLSQLLFDTQYDYQNLNGRIFGNLLANILAGHEFFCELFRCGIIMGILFLVKKISGFGSAYGYLLTFLFLFFIPAEIFRQTYAWMAGFYNYVPPVLLILIYVWIISDLFRQKDVRLSSKWIFPIFLLGFLSQFFVENISLFNVFMSICIIFWHRLRQKTFSVATISYGLGTIAGVAIMFLSPVYHKITQGEDLYQYRQMGFSVKQLLTTFKANYPSFSQYLIGENYLLLLGLSLLGGLLLYRSYSKKGSHTFWDVLAALFLLAGPFYSIVSTKLLENYQLDSFRYIAVDFLVYFAYFLSIGYTILFHCRKPEYKWKSLFFLCSSVIVELPMLIVSPIGARCFYISYVFLVCTVFLLGKDLSDQAPSKTHIWSFLKIPLIFMTCILFLFYGWIYANVAIMDHQMIRHIEDSMQEGLTEIELPISPYNNYLHDHTTQKYGYIYYYNSVKDITFTFIPYADWLNKYM